MNIEDIVPELFGEKRVYYCQRCLNHGLREKRKNHKQNCAYSMCQCSDCIMVERRRELNSRLVQIEGEPGSQRSSESPSGCDEATGKAKERRPNCQRCAQHNVVNRLKGHKRACPFKECFCPKCQVVVERQKLMADQIKLRRRQKREKNNAFERPRSPAGAAGSRTTLRVPYTLGVHNILNTRPLEGNITLTEVCLKCTQQAIGYHHLMSILDPSNASDTFLNLSTVLQACPHRATTQNIIESTSSLLCSQVPSLAMGQHGALLSEVGQD